MSFNLHGFRIAVDPGTGEVRILRSVHAADVVTVMNPAHCRGQIEGGVAQFRRDRVFRGLSGRDEAGNESGRVPGNGSSPVPFDVPPPDG